MFFSCVKMMADADNVCSAASVRQNGKTQDLSKCSAVRLAGKCLFHDKAAGSVVRAFDQTVELANGFEVFVQAD